MLIDPIRRREYNVELVRTHKPLTPRVDEWGSERSNGHPIKEKAEPSDGVWVELGTPQEIPQKPDMPTQRELHYIAGVEKLMQTGVLLENGYSGEGEHRFRREDERHSGVKVNNSRSEATLHGDCGVSVRNRQAR